MQVNSLLLRAQAVGPLPIIQRFLDTLQLREILARSRPLRAYVPALELRVKSLLVEPNALYRVRPWSQQYDPRWIGPGTIGDDAIGRALNRLFEADRASLLTHLALSALSISTWTPLASITTPPRSSFPGPTPTNSPERSNCAGASAKTTAPISSSLFIACA